MKSGFIKDTPSKQVGFFVMLSFDEINKHIRCGEWNREAFIKETANEIEIQVGKYLDNPNELGIMVEMGVEHRIKQS